ncbi:NAD(P)-binding protein [Paraphaeosphaeria sporulosa]|uniref:NAD(P)-binding protein n=1 Tax=Paraphaeosphaeria sporulosa TaxID=1460663 RepID=A0A177CF67_9PLEO|nr:NAD(P)-binding protein [Paraphaeosphaeria sporulosa]OAG05458.1 NAD(P)-binding protein [Paraphaeosphaeria sporulosa]
MTTFGWGTTGEEATAAFAQHIAGRTILITGVTPGGLGLETARVIALRDPKLVILAGRSTEKLQQAEEDVKKAAPNVSVRQLVLDLGSLKATRIAAEEVNNWSDVPSIDVVINNAGIMATPYALTADGIESQFATNHVAHFLFTQLLMPKILASGSGARVVNLSSSGYKGGPVRFDDYNFDGGQKYEKWASYGQSKSANVLYARGLRERYGNKGLQAYGVHPGAIWTNLGHHAKDDLRAMGFMDEAGNTVNSERLKWKTLDQGVSTTIVAAFDPSIADQSGAYLADCQVEETQEDWMQDPEGPEKLWKLSEQLVGQEFPAPA